MEDTSIKKVSAHYAPHGEEGQQYLASGKAVSMRLWKEDATEAPKPESRRDYETVGYVLGGRAELLLAGQKVLLEPGDSWIVPRGTAHQYHILEEFEAVEATAPPAHVHGRDLPHPSGPTA